MYMYLIPRLVQTGPPFCIGSAFIPLAWKYIAIDVHVVYRQERFSGKTCPLSGFWSRATHLCAAPATLWWGPVCGSRGDVWRNGAVWQWCGRGTRFLHSIVGIIGLSSSCSSSGSNGSSSGSGGGGVSGYGDGSIINSSGRGSKRW